MNQPNNNEVFIFDGDPCYGNFLVEVFDRQGLKAKHCSSGDNALEQLKEERPGIVVLDLTTPHLDGEVLCNALKSDPALQSTKLIVVSGNTFTDDRTRVIWAQADLYVLKSFDVADFADQMNVLVPHLV